MDVWPLIKIEKRDPSYPQAYTQTHAYNLLWHSPFYSPAKKEEHQTRGQILRDQVSLIFIRCVFKGLRGLRENMKGAIQQAATVVAPPSVSKWVRVWPVIVCVCVRPYVVIGSASVFVSVSLLSLQAHRTAWADIERWSTNTDQIVFFLHKVHSKKNSSLSFIIHQEILLQHSAAF